MFSTCTKIELVFVVCLLRWRYGIDNSFAIITDLEFGFRDDRFEQDERDLLVHRFERCFPRDENVVEVNVRDVPYFRCWLDLRLTNRDVSMWGLERDTKEKDEVMFREKIDLLHRLFDGIGEKQ